MEALVDAFEWIIEFFKTVWGFIQNIFSAITVAFDIIARIITMSFEYILTFPVWIQGFLIVTITISVVYFIVGRSAGKSDTK